MCYIKRTVVEAGEGGRSEQTARHELRSCVPVSPVSDPAGVTVRALAEHGVAVVSVFADGTHLLAVVSEETFGAVLVTPRPVPASLAGDAAALRHLARLLALAVAAPWVVQSKTRPTEREKKKKMGKNTINPTFRHHQSKRSIFM